MWLSLAEMNFTKKLGEIWVCYSHGSAVSLDYGYYKEIRFSCTGKYVCLT